MNHNIKLTKVKRSPSKSAVLRLTEWAVPIERLSVNAIELLADNAQQRFPEICDVRFRKIAIGRVRVLQRKNLF